MSDKQGWLIPKGADGGEFKYQVAYLKSIAGPLDDSMEAARKIREERSKAALKSLTTFEKSGSGTVTEAVHGFLDKWCHGLGVIVDDSELITGALHASINDFLATDTEVAYKAMMAERQKKYEDEHPVSTWLEEHGVTGEQKRYLGPVGRGDLNRELKPVDHSDTDPQDQG
ncbi:hypothetical protein ACFV6E_11925 [Streptomyces sp. NPDC059785]|uniref:hypothetical protein n=1 Tax=unclassified Streptomyces TaxID=2593676 RepID=UPI00365D18F2